MGDIPKLPEFIAEQVRRAEYEAPVNLSSYKSSDTEKTTQRQSQSTHGQSVQSQSAQSQVQLKKQKPPKSLKKTISKTLEKNSNKKVSKSLEKEKVSAVEVPVTQEPNEESQKAILRGIIDTVKGKKEKRDKIEDDQRELHMRIEALKEEVHGWMTSTDTERVKWEGHGIKKKEKAKIQRITIGDVLDIVMNTYGEQAMDSVIQEVQRIHVASNANQYELKLISLNPSKKRGRIDSKNTSKRAKTSMEL